MGICLSIDKPKYSKGRNIFEKLHETLKSLNYAMIIKLRKMHSSQRYFDFFNLFFMFFLFFLFDECSWGDFSLSLHSTHLKLVTFKSNYSLTNSNFTFLETGTVDFLQFFPLYHTFILQFLLHNHTTFFHCNCARF